MKKYFIITLSFFSFVSYSQIQSTPNKILNILESYKSIYPIVKLTSKCQINNINNNPFSLSLVYDDNKDYSLDIYMDDIIEINYTDINSLKYKCLFTNVNGQIYMQETIISKSFTHYNLYLNNKQVYTNTIIK